MKNLFFVAVVFAFTLIGCSSKQVKSENLIDKEWKLVEYVDGSTYSIDENENIIISFRDSAMVAGNTGCNLFIGTYSLNESKLDIECLGLTKVFCGEEKAQMEQSYMNALSFELDAEMSSNGEELILKNAEKGINIKYIKCDGIEFTNM